VSDRQFVKVHSKSVLFLCTGNYYRSRFAEELFNHFAAIKGLNWVASSAALAIERCAVNVGSLSPYTLSALNDRGIRAVKAGQKPQPCTVAHLEAADLIIALDESEHRLLISERFVEWADRVRYWHVKDLDLWQPAVALGLIEREVTALISTLYGTVDQVE